VKAPPVSTLAATTIDEHRLQEEVAHIKQAEAHKKAQQQAYVHQLQAKAAAARAVRQQEQQHLAMLKKKQQHAQAQMLQIERDKHQVEQEKLRLEQQKAEAAKRLRALQAKNEKAVKAMAALHAQQKKVQEAVAATLKVKKEAALKAKKTQALQSQSKRLQQQLMSQQLSEDAKELAAARAKQQQSMMNHYKEVILKEISEHWVVPHGVDNKLTCVYLVELAPGGVVLSLKLIRSSGNSALDRSAEAAIYKSSPLSVPKEPTLFDNFRELRLTVSPKTVIKLNG